mmetsp:Transcript_28291/g.71794  ORF Transcript_28291/g.71794 Transcript_28291/m.71794 type:complete len:195 (-) Transcript_28291:706-1290(-)|eukprot:CAMPEP_0178983526 /NCGR_PEP_ID=MMETSP0795-20121207/1108_1 /TAXON_ID=88552 /ORGANISM="Amoebophrya sp., Strain Ameob2" /LENGTH=194 /DNA_ID=CAMNT_0020674307 /DNA_START=328 /DNA_END=912 /DNA_ORIENTATION=-
MEFVNLIELAPRAQLEFTQGQTQGEEQSLVLKNVNSTPVAWKVKTTAPKAYLVRPSSALLMPGDSASVQICLQPSASPPDFGTHRFLVQATACEAGKTANLQKAEWEKLGKGDIKEARLTVIEKPAGAGGKKADGGGLAKNYDELVQYVVQLEQETIELQKKLKTAKSGWKSWHLILSVIIACVAMKLALQPPQ